MIRPFLPGLSLVFAALLLAAPATATQPPEPGMIERMKREGTYRSALDFAMRLGNHELKIPRHGDRAPETDPAKLAEQIAAHMGQSLDGAASKALSAATQDELNWMQLDLNHDRVVDERDLLVLGFPQPKKSSALPTVGTVKIFALLIGFDEYEPFFTQEEIQETLFGPGNDDFYYKGLAEYYRQASYGQLNFEGKAYGWHHASQPRSYYHPDDNNDYPTDDARRQEIVMEAILAADAAGEDFSQYDNDGDGSVDSFLVIWTGPHGDWSTFWWGYFGVSLPGSFLVDGKSFTSFSWQWERYYSFGQNPPEPAAWDPLVTIHETGHALGLPDYYDYDDSVGPQGGVGGLDIMHGNWGDHGAFNKYVLGWLSPTIAHTNLDDQLMRATGLNRDAVLVMPGYDPVSPWQEYFIVQNRHRVGLDSTYPADGVLIWHIDARLNNTGGSAWNNSSSSHKLIRLMEADGLEEIETGDRNVDAGDFYNMGESFGPATVPNSNRYDGSATNILVDDITADNPATLTADFTLYSSNPPQVQITAPTGGDTISGTSTVTVTATDDVGVSTLQLFIDGELVSTAASGSLTYTWNSLVDFNKPLNLQARAWDAEGQSGTAITGVTVANAGVTSFSDTFNSAPDALVNWRVQNYPQSKRGQLTFWSTRTSPANPPRTGAGNETYVRRIQGGSNTTDYRAEEGLRAQRLDISGFTRPAQLRFQYRNRGGMSLWVTTDEGQTWQRLENLPVTNDWVQYNKTHDLTGSAAYFRFFYNGNVRVNTNSNQSGNIADFSVREAPSDPPAVSFISPADNAVLTGDMVFDTDATDDGTVAQVKFYILGAEVSTDTSAPFNYTRNTDNDDNDPALVVEAVATDNDGLTSEPARITVALANPKTWPGIDDLELGTDNWTHSQNGANQEFGPAPGQGRGGGMALGYVTPGAWEDDTDEGTFFIGDALPSGRRAIDLSNPLCLNPQVIYWYRGELASDQSVSVYFYTTWRGYQYIGGSPGSAADWTRYSLSLIPYIGQSGRLVFWVFGGNNTDGSAAYWDDISIDNSAPVINGVFPNSGYPGQSVTVSGSFFGPQRSSSSVAFGGVACAEDDYLSWSNTALSVRVPAGAADGDVVVTVDGRASNGEPFTISPVTLSFTGIDSAALYTWETAPLPLAVTASAGIERVELWVGTEMLDGSTDLAGGFSDLSLPVAQLRNGRRSAVLQGYTVNGHMVTSAAAPFSIYSLPGDVNGDGLVGAGDDAELKLHLGALRFQPGYEFWYDPDDDGVVSEADLSYIGYNWGTTSAVP